jgi:hypothetical protein
MINNDLTDHCERELELWVMNDEYFQQQWRHTIRTGSMSNIKDAFDEAGFTYREDQWAHLVDLFEEELEENEKALAERNPA